MVKTDGVRPRDHLNAHYEYWGSNRHNFYTGDQIDVSLKHWEPFVKKKKARYNRSTSSREKFHVDQKISMYCM